MFNHCHSLFNLSIMVPSRLNKVCKSFSSAYCQFDDFFSSHKCKCNVAASCTPPPFLGCGLILGGCSWQQKVQRAEGEALAEGDPEGMVTEWVAGCNSFVKTLCSLSTHNDLLVYSPFKKQPPCKTITQHERDCKCINPWWPTTHQMHLNNCHIMSTLHCTSSQQAATHNKLNPIICPQPGRHPSTIHASVCPPPPHLTLQPPPAILWPFMLALALHLAPSSSQLAP